ncbi:hypothetical protein H6P81_019216 [Aristolochia fimbriata]|uniref:Uncharacterized protein n=1 Tax=Aristolochia fimbriata TaxID=158543 RepID=A0AAV7DTS4_ARIFI|nr:hypothetical protein H6P81_019216 [Aristolochia fimbriata]
MDVSFRGLGALPSLQQFLLPLDMKPGPIPWTPSLARQRFWTGHSSRTHSSPQSAENIFLPLSINLQLELEFSDGTVRME